MPSKQVLLVLGVIAFLACGTPTGGCSCQSFTYQSHFVGFVTASAGPVSGTRVTASVYARDCRSTAGSLSYLAANGALTDSLGRYRFEFQTSRADTLCARLVAHTASDSSVRDSVAVQIPPDTVRVDFAFR